jgi:hypothetical protein
VTLRTVIVGVQTLTFVALAWLLLTQGEWKLGAAQAMLGVITVLIYL